MSKNNWWIFLNIFLILMSTTANTESLFSPDKFQSYVTDHKASAVGDSVTLLIVEISEASSNSDRADGMGFGASLGFSKTSRSEAANVDVNMRDEDTMATTREVTTSQSVFQNLVNTDKHANIMLVPQLSTSHDLSQGTLKPSDNNLNFAIDGDAFFVVGTSEKTLYTRKGEFIVDQTGRLALLSGERVQGVNGDISLDQSDFEILKDGIVRQNEMTVGKLKIVKMDQSGQPSYLGNGFLATSTPLALANSQEFSVMQGYTETSNVNMQDEMLKMIELTRHFEASANILKAYDDLLDASINIIGEV